VLLKNDGALPLDCASVRTIGVIGPNADSRRALEGNYEGTASRYITPLEGIRSLAEPLGIRVMYAQGCHLFRDHANVLSAGDDRFAEARSVAKRSDAVVLFLGLDADIEGEESDEYSLGVGGDKKDLSLPGRQGALLREVIEAAAGKPVIVAVISGSSLDLREADEKAGAVIQAFYPGSAGGRAIAELLFGVFSPSGKLPVTFYRSTDDLPDFRNYSMQGRTYRYPQTEPLYPFGYGLTYTTFGAEGLSFDGSDCRLRVTNTGRAESGEVVQVYVRSEGRKEAWNLCGIKPVRLRAGESADVCVPVSPNAFMQYDENGDLQPVCGPHRIYAGFTQPDERSAELYGSRPLELNLNELPAAHEEI